MKKITLLSIIALLICSFSASAASTLPITGTLSPTIPTDWTYVSNDPAKYPNPSFYTTVAGLKLNFENMGVISPEFNAQSEVRVTLNVAQLNQNTKTAASTNCFTITALNAAGETVGTATLTTVIVGDNVVDIKGTNIVKVKVIMTGYPNDGTKYCNVNLASVTIIAKTTGINDVTADALQAFVSGKNLVIKNAVNGSTVEIFSALGSKVLTSTLEDGKVSLDNLSKGLYVVRIGKKAQKFML